MRLSKKNTIGILIFAVCLLFVGVVVHATSRASNNSNVIKVGLLWSDSGSTASDEEAMTDSAMMAIKEINKSGGIGGKKIKVYHEDYGGSPATAATKMRILLEKDQVNVVLGCDTSASRVAVIPTLKKDNGLLIYPVITEGKEVSKNVIYMGSIPNQTTISAINYVMKKTGGKKVFMVGSDYVFPRTVNSIAAAVVKKNGGKIVGSQYEPMTATDWSSVVSKIKQAKPDIIFSSAVGDSGVAFYKELKQQGIDANKTPVIATALYENTVKAMGGYYASGIYTASSFNQYVNTKPAQNFVKKYNATYHDGTVVNENTERAYDAVYMLKAAIEKSGQYTDTTKLTKAFSNLSIKNSPAGEIKIDSKNHSASLKAYISQIQRNGSWKILSTSKGLIKAQPWPKVLYPNYKDGMPASVAKQLK